MQVKHKASSMTPLIPCVSQTCIELEAYLGDINKSDNTFSYKRAVAEDELSKFPKKAIEKLNHWGMYQYYIPKDCNGKFDNFQELYWLTKMISQRDLTVAIAYAKTFLGSIAVWMAGDEIQKKQLSSIIKEKNFVSLGLTETEHGSDLLATDVQAKVSGDNLILNGKKWLINNATNSRALTVFANLVEGNKKSLILLLIDKEKLSDGSYTLLDKIKTHGIKGADISGIEFKNALLHRNSIIGQHENGLATILRSLQITRTLCCSLSLGGTQTALRTVSEFSLTRKLYNKTVFDMEQPRKVLTSAFAKLLGLELCGLMASRMLHELPEKMSLYSSVVKYIIPFCCNEIIQDISVVLGARYYLREGFNDGIFQKIMRDCELVPLFDGNTIINLKAIAV